MMDRNLTFTKTVTMITELCCSCGVCFGIPSDLKDALLENKNSFYCPNGHSQSYTGTNKDQKIKELQANLERKEQQRLYEESRRIEAQKQLDKVERKLKRVHNGVCPCCNRSFENLRNHMQTKHPEEFKNFIDLINNPHANVKDGIFLKQLTQSEKKKLKQK